MGPGVRGSTMIEPLNLSHHPHGRKMSRGCPEDLEMGVAPARSPLDKPSEMDIYPRGITVTKVVHSS